MSTEPTEMYGRGEQEDAEKPDVDNWLTRPHEAR